ncbi:MAG: ABC transporter ATP-binding protein [Spirochaetales bacterium]|nr:ABC transporter ATP-binding protein [Spirochaetales bacterium]
MIKDSRNKTIFRILKLAKPHKVLFTGFILCIIFTAFLDSLGTYITKSIIDEGILAGSLEQVIYFCKLYGLTYLINSLSFFGFIYCAGRLAEQIQYDLREKLFNHIQELSFSFFDKSSSGWLLSRITSDTTKIADLVSWMLLDSVWGFFNITISLIFMAKINLKLAGIMALILPALVFTAFKFKTHILGEYRKVRSINSKITAAYNENFTGVKIVKALTREKQNLRNFGGLTGDMYNTSFRAAWLSALFLPAVQLIITFALGAILWFGGFQIQLGEMTIGGLRAFIGYITFMLWPIQELARVFSEMQQSIAGAERVFGLLDTESEIQDKKGAEDEASFQGEIEFKDVVFHYKEDNPILSEFNLQINPGETIAIVGPTGGGKTTIASLISRYYEPVSGRILIDGRDYRDYTQKALQGRIGVVLQKPHLFSGTIRENIEYGKPGATEDEIVYAAKTAHSYGMITGLPNGWDELVGEEGTLLSQGQKQLISLTRAILASPDILIMDEATSSIDTLTEKNIQQGIAALLAGRTSIIIAHRLSTIKDADRILVVQDGKITESGTHAGLLKEKGHYYGLYTSQFRKERTATIGLLD